MPKTKKGFMDMSFTWIFAIMAGIVILTMAFYLVGNLKDIMNLEKSAEAGMSLQEFLGPMETSIESEKVIKINMGVQSRIKNHCDSLNNFGRQIISVDHFIKGEWTNAGVEISFNDKYIFSDDLIIGEKFTAFSKPLEFPFKIANLIYLISDDKKYCFSGARPNLKTEIRNLNMENLIIDSCPADAIKICFPSGSNCDIRVNYDSKRVSKDGKVVKFKGEALMFAAIFSDPEIYECQLQRLMKRGKILAELYNEKALELLSVNCNANIKSDFLGLIAKYSEYETSTNLESVDSVASLIKTKNKMGACRLW